MSDYPVFYDSTRPLVIPTPSWAALYYDGIYGPAGQAAASRFERVRWITIGADYPHAGVIDFEPGNPAYDDEDALPVYAEGRTWHMPTGRRSPFRVYTNRADAHMAWQRLDSIPISPKDPRAGTLAQAALWWIATADSQTSTPPQIPWNPQDLAADLAARWQAPIPSERIWADQNWWNPVAQWDRSNLFKDF